MSPRKATDSPAAAAAGNVAVAASDGARVVDGCSVSGWAGARCIARPSVRPAAAC